MEKQGTAKILEEIAVLLELKGENPFKSRAYYSAARTVELMGEEELQKLIMQDKLKEVRGIGAALEEKLKELVGTGRLAYYEELKASVPHGLVEMLKIPGLGPRKVRSLNEMLGITTLAELEYACRENRLVNLKGFGNKTQQNILEGIEFIRRNEGRFFYGEALAAGKRLIESLKGFGGLEELSLAGSVRRCREIVKDIDLVAAAVEPKQLISYFTGLDSVSSVSVSGDTRASVRLEDGIGADLRVVSKKQFPFALHHFTGSKEHNTALRHLARSKGLKINEYGIFKSNSELIECRNEVEFFETLGLSYIVPELRENNGEIEAAAEGKLPALVEEKDIRGVFHVHTTYSDGMNTLEEVVSYCSREGFEYVGITDHSQSAFYAGGLKKDDLAAQKEEIYRLREKYPEIGIFHGVESDIRSDGSLDYDDAVLEELDFVIASVHSGLKMDRGKMTARIVKALAHPCVTMLGHPTNRLLLGREGSFLDLDRVFSAARENGVVLELNASPARLDLDWRYLKRTRDMGLVVSINPDAHRLESFSDIKLGVAVARKGWLDKNRVFNTGSRAEIEDYLLNR